MTTAIQRAETGQGRVLTFVADDQHETSDDAPRVYLGATSELIRDGVRSEFVTRPTVEVFEMRLSPEHAVELARRLMIAAANITAVCECGHQWWEHYDGRPCGHADAGTREVCRCARFDYQIASADR